MKIANELVPRFEGEDRVSEVYFWNPRYRPQHQVFETWLCCGADSNRVSVATEAGGDPKYINLLNSLNLDVFYYVASENFFELSCPRLLRNRTWTGNSGRYLPVWVTGLLRKGNQVPAW